jgi:hypothetical protein
MCTLTTRLGQWQHFRFTPQRRHQMSLIGMSAKRHKRIHSPQEIF